MIDFLTIIITPITSLRIKTASEIGDTLITLTHIPTFLYTQFSCTMNPGQGFIVHEN